MIVLGIETSCDETAVAIVNDRRDTLAHRLLSQYDAHRPYGGVVPEIAARSHLEHLDGLVADALREAGIALAGVDGIAATAGPGLIGGVIVGVMTAKALALASGKPFVAVNHLEGHALTARFTDSVRFPFLLLLVSGGHCQLLLARDIGAYDLLGGAVDDAAGEAFDKCAKLLGLAYPGGPSLERAARGGDPGRFALPRPMAGRPGCDFSFSGLKTAVRRHCESRASDDAAFAGDLAASFQVAVADVLADRVVNAIAAARARAPTLETFVVAGGVAANAALRARLAKTCAARNLRFVAPRPALCTDNGVMIAWAGLERLRRGLADPLDIKPRPRWPIGVRPADGTEETVSAAAGTPG